MPLPTVQNPDCFYIDGQWQQPASPQPVAIINPATEQALLEISFGSEADVDRAVVAASAASAGYARTSAQERIELIDAILAEYDKRYQDIAYAISAEMGAPISLATEAHAMAGKVHFETYRSLLENYRFESQQQGYYLRREPIGVCGLITPWNWPVNQIASKVAPALAAGCTMVLKPSELAPLNALIFAEVLDAAGVPKGVFNLVNGDGASAGAALSQHPDVRLMSLTGSTRAGVAVAIAAAPTVKRVTQELGGKSANIILDDADLATAVTQNVQAIISNSGQTCVAPTRMLVPETLYPQAKALAVKALDTVVVGDPQDARTTMGPVVSRLQFDKIQSLIQTGIDEGASLLAGGTGRPAHCPAGYFVKPTLFADVSNAMTIAREEIFGPVLCLIPYRDEAEAIAIANDSVYGLAGYVQSSSVERALAVAAQLQAGSIVINHAAYSHFAPFGGYKQSGNGREGGVFGLEEFLETKAVFV